MLSKKATAAKPAAKPTPAPDSGKLVAHAVYQGPEAEIEVEGVGVMFIGQGVPETHPAFETVSKHPAFKVVER